MDLRNRLIPEVLGEFSRRIKIRVFGITVFLVQTEMTVDRKTVVIYLFTKIKMYTKTSVYVKKEGIDV